MSQRLVEARIQAAQQRGDLDDLAGNGRPIDLREYFGMQPELRPANYVLNRAGLAPIEIQLMPENASITERLAAEPDAQRRSKLARRLQELGWTCGSRSNGEPTDAAKSMQIGMGRAVPAQ